MKFQKLIKKYIKVKDHEKLDDANINRVTKLLSQEVPITKKEACIHLNIAYNTKRLATIIENYEDKKARDLKFRKRLRGTPLSDGEIKTIIVNYLLGDSSSAISKYNYRSKAIIEKCLKDNNVPTRSVVSNYWNPELLPDESVKEEFKKDEIVWSARYNCVAVISSKLNSHVYSIWLYGKHNEFAYQPYWELGYLSFIDKYNITLDDIGKTVHKEFNLRIQ